MYYETNMPSTITVGSGYVNIQSPGFFGAGDRNVTTDQIASAYIGQIGFWELDSVETAWDQL